MNCRFSNIDRRTRGSPPRSWTRCSQTPNTQRTNSPRKISTIVGDSPRIAGAPGFGKTHPHALERSIPKTASPSPVAESTAPTRSRWVRDSTGASCTRRASTRIIATITNLTDENPPPREVRGGDPADQWAERHRDRPGRHNQAVGARPALGREVARDERDDRGKDQGRADPLQERPPDDEDREVRRDRRREGPSAVDHAPDRERALASDQRPDLAPRDHEHRHHERVERDRRLDARDRGADVLGDRRDRDVHDRAVEGHQELARREREQDEPGLLRSRRRPSRADGIRGGRAISASSGRSTLASRPSAKARPHRPRRRSRNSARSGPRRSGPR